MRDTERRVVRLKLRLLWICCGLVSQFFAPNSRFIVRQIHSISTRNPTDVVWAKDLWIIVVVVAITSEKKTWAHINRSLVSSLV